MGFLESGRAEEETVFDRMDLPSPSRQSKSQPPQDDQLQRDPSLMETVPPNEKSSRKWTKRWVPQNTVLNNGKCLLSKWVTEDTAKAVEERPHEEEPLPEPEYEVAFLCRTEGCGRIFTEATAMRKHAQLHMEKQFICSYEGCGRKCPDATKLKRHLLTHTGEKQFVCTFEGCGKVFSSEINLNQHLKTHLKENYHTCPYEECDKRYAHESKLKAHIRSHHERNWVPDVKSTPPLVERESVNPRLLTPIAGAATLDRPFSCPYEGCNKIYKHEYKLNLHLRREHAGPSYEENEKQVRTSDVEDEMDEGSEHDEDVGKFGIINSSGRGKLRIISKPPGSSLKRKQSSVAAVDLNIKANPKAPIGRSGLFVKEESEEDSEKTEEDKEDTEDEGWGNRINIETEDEEDDEETEDERS